MHNINTISLARCTHEVCSSLMKKSYVFFWKKGLLQPTLFSFSLLTIFQCLPNQYRTFWSLTMISHGQHLKFIFGILVKISKIFSLNSCFNNRLHDWIVCWALLSVKHPITYYCSMSGIFWQWCPRCSYTSGGRSSHSEVALSLWWNWSVE